jgi:hypothetical protein
MKHEVSRLSQKLAILRAPETRVLQPTPNTADVDKMAFLQSLLANASKGKFASNAAGRGPDKQPTINQCYALIGGGMYYDDVCKVSTTDTLCRTSAHLGLSSPSLNFYNCPLMFSALHAHYHFASYPVALFPALQEITMAS